MVVLWANLNFHSLTLRRSTGPRMVPLDLPSWRKLFGKLRYWPTSTKLKPKLA